MNLEYWKDPTTTAWYIFVSDYSNRRVVRYTVSGNSLINPFTIYTRDSSNNYVYPAGLALDSSGSLFVACSDNYVRQYNGLTGALIRTIGGSPYMSMPGDVAVSPDGLYVYVTNGSSPYCVTQWKRVSGL